MPTEPIRATSVARYDKVKTALFFLGIGFLAVLMGWLNYGALRAALYTGTFMSFAIFTRSDMVVNPGWSQIADTLLVAIATCGIATATFGRFMKKKGVDILLRAALALASVVVMLYPDGNVALAAAVIVLPATVWGVFRHRPIAPPKSGLQSQPVG